MGTRKAFTIGVAGHVDHGKTTLVRALTGIDTDRKAAEKARGLSIESGVAELKLASGREAALIDVPGHTDFLKNAIRGLSGVDLAILVVAADDGVMPQTREHLEILKFFRAAAGMVVISKIDLVDKETLTLAELELEELLGGSFFAPCPCFKFSSQRPDLSGEIKKGIDAALDKVTANNTPKAAPFRLWIDQVRSIRGHGTVVSGTVGAGAVRRNDALVLLPAGSPTRARTLETHAREAPRAETGQRVGINLNRLPMAAVRRGMCLAAPGRLDPVYLLNAEIQMLASAPWGIKDRQRVKIYLGTAVTNALVVLMGKERLGPAESALAQIRLMRPVAALPQDPFVIAPMNRNRVVAGGRVLEISRQKFRTARAAALLPQLEALRHNDAPAYLNKVVDQTPGRLITAKALARKTGLPPLAFERCISAKVQKGEWVYLKGHGAIAGRHLQRLQARFKAAVEAAFDHDPLKRSVGLPEVAERMGAPIDGVLLERTADALCSRGELHRLEGGYGLAGQRPCLDASQEAQIAFVLGHIQSAGLTPISPQFFCRQHRPPFSKAVALRLFTYLARRKQLIRLDNGRFLTRDALAEIKKRVASAIAQRGFVTLGDCKALFGYGRSGGAHVLDYLNQIGFTERREDRHYLVPVQKW
jgi:selenocysteine-specific elongation factor